MFGFTNMAKKPIFVVPRDYDVQALKTALSEGRVYVKPSRQEMQIEKRRLHSRVNNIVARIQAYAVAPRTVEEVWSALLEDEGRMRHFIVNRRSPHIHTADSVNRYYISALVNYMLSCGLYDQTQCSFKELCHLLFSDEDAVTADMYRRGWSNYSYYEDECVIRSFIATTGVTGNLKNVLL